MDETGPSIKLLDNATVHLIAAGEVVDRPASIVKELIENAIDAKSSRISVELTTSHGRISKIHIVDDGTGIPPSEVPLAFLPHATSKIRSGTDLESCMTLGFRGEALASIAAVSYVTMVTSSGKNKGAVRYRITGGEFVECTEVGAPPGSSVTVEEIFFNTPARRKFLRSLQTEISQITTLVESLACLYPVLTFRYIINSQEKFSTHGGSSLADIFRALFPDKADKMISIDTHDNYGRISGLISSPELARQVRQRFLIAVNGRYIQSPSIVSAVKRGYSSLIPSASWPVAVLIINLPPSTVDANIHPTKREIRFSDERSVLDWLTKVVRSALQGADVLPHPDCKNVLNPLIQTREDPREGESKSYAIPVSSSLKVCEPTLSGYRRTSRQLLQTRIQDLPAEVPDNRFPRMHWVGQVAGMYIVAEDDAGTLYLIDQHAAHERVRYEQVVNHESNHMHTQELISPVILNLSRSENEILTSVLSVLQEEGFIIDPFGQCSWCVRGVPEILGRYEDPETVTELIGSILFEDKNHVRLKERVIRLVACRSAVKAGVILTPEQGNDIIDQLSGTIDPWTCPHGRPTIVAFKAEELTRMFRRS